MRSGAGEHRIDGEPVRDRPGVVTVIGARPGPPVPRTPSGLRGAAAALHRRGAGRRRPSASRRLAARPGAAGGRSRCPPASAERFEAVFAALARRGARARRTRTPPTSSATSCSTLLLWLERWHDARAHRAPRRRRRRGPAAPALRPPAGADFAAHHDAAHYADALAVPAAGAVARARPRHRPRDQGADHRPRDARGRAAAALHRPARSARSPSGSASATRCTSRARSSAARRARRRPTATRRAALEVHGSARFAHAIGASAPHSSDHEP